MQRAHRDVRDIADGRRDYIERASRKLLAKGQFGEWSHEGGWHAEDVIVPCEEGQLFGELGVENDRKRVRATRAGISAAAAPAFCHAQFRVSRRRNRSCDA